MGADASKSDSSPSPEKSTAAGQRRSSDARRGSDARRPSLPKRILRRCSSGNLGAGKRSTSFENLPLAPSAEEARLAERLATESAGPTGPPFYAVADAWLSAWSAFALAAAPPPGPIANSPLVAENNGRAEALWLSAEDWHLLHSIHGGGPVLCRPSRSLQLQLTSGTDGTSTGSRDPGWMQGKLGGGMCDTAGTSSTIELEASLGRAADWHASRCQELEQELSVQVARLEKTSWAKRKSLLRKQSEGLTEARQRFARAVATACGGEELRASLQDLREAGDVEGPNTFDPPVSELCVHEEARIVIACILQAVQDSDRLALELWLEQAGNMGLETLSEGFEALLGPLNQHVVELEEREKTVLARHSQLAIERKEGPAERVWRLSISAYEAEDEATLADLVHEAKSLGLDVSGSEMLLEELEVRRRLAAYRSMGAGFRSSAFNTDAGSSYADFASAERAQKRRGPSKWSEPSSWATPGSGDWRDPSSWRSTEDFLNAWRKWKHQERTEQFGAEEAERMRRDEEQERERDEAEMRWRRQREAEREEQERERRRRAEESEERWNRWASGQQGSSNQGWRGYQGYSGGYSSGYGSGYGYSHSGGYGNGYRAGSSSYGGFTGGGYGNNSGYNRQSSATSSSAMSTGEALSILGFSGGRIPSLADAKAAYRKAALKSHPDRPHNRDRKEQATAEFQRVKAAFDILAAAAPNS